MCKSSASKKSAWVAEGTRAAFKLSRVSGRPEKDATDRNRTSASNESPVTPAWCSQAKTSCIVDTRRHWSSGESSSKTGVEERRTKSTKLESARERVSWANSAPQLHDRPLEALQTGQLLSLAAAALFQPAALFQSRPAGVNRCALPAEAARVPSFQGKPTSIRPARSPSLSFRFLRRAAAVRVTWVGVAKSFSGARQDGNR